MCYFEDQQEGGMIVRKIEEEKEQQDEQAKKELYLFVRGVMPSDDGSNGDCHLGCSRSAHTWLSRVLVPKPPGHK